MDWITFGWLVMRQDAYIVCDLYVFGSIKKKCVFEKWEFQNIFLAQLTSIQLLYLSFW